MNFGEIEEAFGVSELPNALFYSFPWGLRLELSDVETASGTRHLERFLDALTRAKIITHACLNDSQTVDVFLSRYGPKHPAPAMPKVVDQLEDIGFDGGRLNYCGSVKHDDDWMAGDHRHWYSCKLLGESREIDKLIWNCVAEDMGIQPYVEWADIFFTDLKRRMIVHVYDDRGMDVVAMDKKTLQPFYGKFNKWLLDYDRETMVEKFG